MMNTYDLIVIGAGAIGSAAAYHAAARGQRVLMIEQFTLDHQRGSSYGRSRIIRYSYDQPVYVRWARAVYPMWRVLQAEAGEPLFVEDTGGIDIGRPDQVEIEQRVASLTAERIPFELLTPDETAKRFPQFRLADDQIALYQAQTGVLRASRCVQAHARLAQARGAQVRENTAVTALRTSRDGVEIDAGGETFSAARVILAAGGWVNDLLRPHGLSLPLQVVRCQENYFAAQPADQFAAGRLPTFIAYVQPEFGLPVYGIPCLEDEGVKVAWHGGSPIAHAGESKSEPDAEVSDRARAFSRRYLPGADAPLVSSRVCLYTMTPDEHFIIDTLPGQPQVVIGACCSGHAFKFSTLIGSILVDLALDGRTAHEIAPFALSRFGG